MGWDVELQRWGQAFFAFITTPPAAEDDDDDEGDSLDLPAAPTDGGSGDSAGDGGFDDF